MEPLQHFETALATLEALYFFTQGVKGESAEHLSKIREIQRFLVPSGYPKLLMTSMVISGASETTMARSRRTSSTAHS